MRSLSRWFIVFNLFALGLVAASLLGSTAAQARPQATLIIYDDALASGWANWSWDATVNLNNTTPVHGGTHAIAVTYTAAWGALYLHADPAVEHQRLRYAALLDSRRQQRARANCGWSSTAMTTNAYARHDCSEHLDPDRCAAQHVRQSHSAGRSLLAGYDRSARKPRSISTTFN